MVLSYAIQRIDGILTSEMQFQQGVREGLMWLKEELPFLLAFLKDSKVRQSDDARFHSLVDSIDRLSEDILELLQAEEEKEGRASTSRNLLGRLVVATAVRPVHRHITGNQIKGLKKRVLEIKRRKETYNIGSSSDDRGGETSNARHNRFFRLGSSVEDEGLVGRDNVTDKLLGELLKEDPSRRVISIYGMGGLGKSALARKLYHSKLVHEKFTRAFIFVNQESAKDLLRMIITRFDKKADKDNLAKMNERELKEHLQSFLKSRPYLLVLDEVWDSTVWNSLKQAIPDNGLGSRVIITTRNKGATVGGVKNFVHQLCFLSKDESEKLLFKKVDPRTDAKKKIAEKMLEKCGGLPLAINKLGELLSEDDGLDYWLKVEEQNVCKQLRKQGDEDELGDLLTLSYDHMCGHLRPNDTGCCFLYMCMFPEDHKFDVQKLICMWIAEGMIPQEKSTMEVVAEEYLKDLIDCSLVLEAGKLWEKIMKWKVHDLLRDLAIDKAAKLNWFSIFPHCNDPQEFPTSRKHAIHDQITNYISLALPSDQKLQTLVFFNPASGSFLTKNLVSRCIEFKVLGVLNLTGIDLSSKKQLSSVIRILTKLKFLGLSNTGIMKIPKSIAKLSQLQTLLAIGCDGCRLPEKIKELKVLRHLHGSFAGKLYIDTLINLQSLSMVSLDQLSGMDLSKLVSLRTLSSLRFPLKHSSIPIIANLRKLDTLILSSSGNSPSQLSPLSSCKGLTRLCLNGPLEWLPAWDEFPELLSRLILSNSKLKVDPMATLELLPNLSSLELIDAYQGNKMVCNQNGFCELEILRLSDMNNLVEWEVNETAMLKLKGLRIQGCDQLNVVPESLKHVADPGESASIAYINEYCAS